MNSAALLWP